MYVSLLVNLPKAQAAGARAHHKKANKDSKDYLNTPRPLTNRSQSAARRRHSDATQKNGTATKHRARPGPPHPGGRKGARGRGPHDVSAAPTPALSSLIALLPSSSPPPQKRASTSQHGRFPLETGLALTVRLSPSSPAPTSRQNFLKKMLRASGPRGPRRSAALPPPPSPPSARLPAPRAVCVWGVPFFWP